jgi:phospholipase/carboxylesterase
MPGTSAGPATRQSRIMQLPIEWLPASGAPEQLIVLLHGAGEGGAAMAPLAQLLRSNFPQAAVLAPDAPAPAGSATATAAAAASAAAAAATAMPGREWFAGTLGADLAEADVAAALPPLWVWLRAQQARLRVPPLATALAGFGQGAVLALETAVRDDGLAGRVLAFGGRFASLPEQAPAHTTLHLFHGADDAVVPARHARVALQRLARLEGDATLDIADSAGHEMHPALLHCALHRLTSHIPLRTWQAALGAVPAITR